MEPKITRLTIPEYYVGKTVLVTGGTGFLGKVLVEKLLRSCPDIAKVILIIRPRRNVDPQERWDKLCELKLFDRLKKEQPDALKKILVVPGDINEEQFNLSPEHLELLNNEVNVIMHGAASINFGDELISCLKQNTESTYRLAEMALQFKKLESFIYVSTAFSNCDKDLTSLKEKIYKEKTINWRHLFEAKDTDPETFAALSEKIVGKHPVRYTFTKMLAEIIIEEYSAHYPVVVVRPSIVIPTIEEPFPYWSDALNGMSAVCMCVAMAILRIVVCDKDALLEYVPADWTVRVIISSAWDVADRKAKNGCAVYCVSFGPRAQITTNKIYKVFQDKYDVMVMDDQLWHAFLFMTKSIMLYRIASIFLHLIPGLIIDAALKLSGKPTRLIKAYKKITFLMVSKSSYFTLSVFCFDYPELEKMEQRLAPEDVPYFGTTHHHEVDIEDIVVKSNYSAKEFIFNNDLRPEAQEKRRKKAVVLRYVHYAFCTLLLGLIGKAVF